MRLLAALQALGVPPATIDLWREPLAKAMQEFEITGKLRESAFLATICHESANLSHLTENLNYSAAGLARTWPGRFKMADGSPNAAAWAVARNPEAIANAVYSNRMGNGIAETGDGWKYRGRGPLQITGSNNYRAAAQGVGMVPELVLDPDLLLLPHVGALVAAWFWKQAGCNEYANKQQFDTLSDVINIGRPTSSYGDSIGFPARLAAYQLALAAYE